LISTRDGKNFGERETGGSKGGATWRSPIFFHSGPIISGRGRWKWSKRSGVNETQGGGVQKRKRRAGEGVGKSSIGSCKRGRD